MLEQTIEFIIAHSYASLCVISAVCCWRLKLKHQQAFIYIVTAFACFNYAITPYAMSSGSWFYLIFSATELWMVASFVLSIFFLKQRLTYHIILASLSSLIFIAVNFWRYKDKYLAASQSMDCSAWYVCYKPLILIDYYVYAFLVVSPVVGYGILRFVKKGSFYGRPSIVLYHVGFVLLYGCIDHYRVLSTREKR